MPRLSYRYVPPASCVPEPTPVAYTLSAFQHFDAFDHVREHRVERHRAVVEAVVDAHAVDQSQDVAAIAGDDDFLDGSRM